VNSKKELRNADIASRILQRLMGVQVQCNDEMRLINIISSSEF